MQINRKHPDYNMAMGYALTGLQDYRQALDYFTNVIAVRPKHIKGWCGLLDCFAQFGIWKELDKAAAKACDATGQKPIFLVYRAIACLMLKKTKPAIAFLDEAMAISPNTVRKLIKLNPSLLQFSQVTAFLDKHKKASKKKKK